MKNNLGNRSIRLFIFFLSLLTLQAEDFTYALHVDKHTPYVKEPVVLTLDINQTNHEMVLLFNFTLEKSEDYTFQRLDIQESDSYHDLKIRYVYLIYPLRAGDMNLTFELIKKVTNDESVAYSFSGDRDNVKELATVDSTIVLPPVQLNVKPLPPGTALVGDFSLTHRIKKHQAKAYEPLPLQVEIKGVGYPPLLDSILPDEGNFSRFAEKPLVDSFASTKGTHNTITYPMALSHSRSFTLSPIQFKAFNPQTEQSYILSVPEQHFEVQEVAVADLVDTTDTPEVLKEDWSWLGTLLGYMVVFASGYLTALSWKWKKRRIPGTRHPLLQKIDESRDEKALLKVLIAANDTRFAPSIEKLEASLYGDGKINLKSTKQELLEIIT